jgi:hypothetical protein
VTDKIPLEPGTLDDQLQILPGRHLQCIVRLRLDVGGPDDSPRSQNLAIRKQSLDVLDRILLNLMGLVHNSQRRTFFQHPSLIYQLHRPAQESDDIDNFRMVVLVGERIRGR